VNDLAFPHRRLDLLTFPCLAADALPSVSSTKDGEKASTVEEVLRKTEDLDAAFKETVRAFGARL
jgi:hypothetical protein